MVLFCVTVFYGTRDLIWKCECIMTILELKKNRFDNTTVLNRIG